MRIVVASDKFKGSLSASAVSACIAAGARRVDAAIDVVEVPVADGGEGTLDAAVAAGFERRTVTVDGPTGEPLEADFGVGDDGAVIEMALASGLDVLPGGELDPLRASSYGTGQLVRAALDAGCRNIVLGVGGSACTDGGAGMLQALGVRLLDAAGDELPIGGGALARLERVEVEGLDERLADATFVLASDVDNGLLGKSGAAAIFGPQKGASPSDVDMLDAGLARLVDALAAAVVRDPAFSLRPAEAAKRPGAGAAGGVGFAAILLGAKRRAGIEVVLELGGFVQRLDGADAVITGEGSLDAQSLLGKTPIGVARAAASAGLPVYAVCGRSSLSADDAERAGISAVASLADLEPDPERSMRDAASLLETIAERLVRSIAPLRFDLVVRGRALVGGQFAPAEIGVGNGRVSRIGLEGSGLEADAYVDLADDEVLVPGLVDTHVHVNEPGRTEWEGFPSATKAAALGGVTTIIDMPLNSIPPTTTTEALALKRDAAADRVHVDVGFWGGVVPGNERELGPLHDAGVFGFKCFLLPSGVDEFPDVTAAQMREAMVTLAGLDSLLVVHAEDAHEIESSVRPGSRDYLEFLASRPRSAEDTAIAAVIDAATATGARTHILHLSNGDSIGRIAAARADGVDLTVETCPHYLTLAAEDVPAGNTSFKCCPPIREKSNRDALWGGLLDGTIDAIVSDHSPSTTELKFAGDGDFGIAWGGISSLQLGLPLVWTEAKARGVSLERVISLMSERPADRAGLTDKGRIEVGSAADFAIFAPDDTFTVDVHALSHRNPVTPYDGLELSGVVRATYLAGRVVDGDHPRGRLLRRGNIENGAK